MSRGFSLARRSSSGVPDRRAPTLLPVFRCVECGRGSSPRADRDRLSMSRSLNRRRSLCHPCDGWMSHLRKPAGWPRPAGYGERIGDRLSPSCWNVCEQRCRLHFSKLMSRSRKAMQTSFLEIDESIAHPPPEPLSSLRRLDEPPPEARFDRDKGEGIRKNDR